MIVVDLKPAQCDVMESLSEIPTTARENPEEENMCLLKLFNPPKLHQSFTVKGVQSCDQISFLTSDCVWVNDDNNLILTNTNGETLHQLNDLCTDYFHRVHTVFNENELIYIDRYYRITTLTYDNKAPTLAYSTGIPSCLYWSSSTADLLVSKYIYIRYKDRQGDQIQPERTTDTIEHDTIGLRLYSRPCFITESNNGDVVVSDSLSASGAVVVTDRNGRHCLSYTGHPPGSVLEPHGICTDSSLYILVCDVRTKAVQMLDSNGRFLSSHFY